MILVGTSGWQYEDWRGRFYPDHVPKRRWLEYFATRFPTTEVNYSFYRLPSPQTFARWRAETPERFVMAVKASRFITHIRRLRDCRDPVELLWSRAAELGSRLGPILFQLPPTLHADPDLLEQFVRVLPEGMRAAVEFRHPSWKMVEAYRILDRAGVATVLADSPGARVPPVVTGGWAYVRFHQGRPAHPCYAKGKLRRWADRIARLPAEDVFAYFNNDTLGCAVRDATTLASLLRERSGDVPEPAPPGP